MLSNHSVYLRKYFHEGKSPLIKQSIKISVVTPTFCDHHSSGITTFRQQTNTVPEVSQLSTLLLLKYFKFLNFQLHLSVCFCVWGWVVGTHVCTCAHALDHLFVQRDLSQFSLSTNVGPGNGNQGPGPQDWLALHVETSCWALV